MANFLNEQQKLAVEYPLKSVMIMAGAGTGKTTVITNRIAYLINHYHLDPNRILGITFTNKAAEEMNVRIKKAISQPLRWLGTFHKICIQILQHDIHHMNRSNNFKIIADEEDGISIIKELYERNSINKETLSYKQMYYVIDKIKCYDYDVDDLDKNANLMFKLNLNHPDQIRAVKTIYRAYEQKFADYNYLDFNDILRFTNHLLSNYDEVLNYWANMFDVILVDEFQDTNFTQFELLKLLASKNRNIYAVGDQDQSIYQFRGANPEVIQEFVRWGNGVEILKLEENYRSTNQILTIANNLINHNSNRVVKNLFSSYDGEKPKLLYGFDPDGEARVVVDKIKQIIQNEPEINLNEITILYRSNYNSRAFEQALIYNNIPYNLIGGFKFYQRTEIKDMLAYLSIINSEDELSILRVINVPRRKISDKTVKAVLDYAHHHNYKLYEALTKVDEIEELTTLQKQSIHKFVSLMNEFKTNLNQYEKIADLYYDLLKKLEYKEYAKSKEPSRVEKVLENLDELGNALSKQPISNLGKYLQDIQLYTSQDDKKVKDNAVNLMTVHTAKGLEFKHVFLVCFNDGNFPSSRSVETMNGIEEERRLAYVAVTRPKKHLYISYHGGWNYTTQKEASPSRFIIEFGKDHIDQSAINNFVFSTISNKDLEWYDSKKPKLNLQNQYNQELENTYQCYDRVIHTEFGEGIIIGIDNDILEIQFSKVKGVKKIIYNHKSIKRKIN